jgi:DNA-binding NarL/FixJ family response regulator
VGGNHPDLMDEFIMNLPEIVFADVQSMGKIGLNVMKSFKSYHPGLCIIWITSHDQPEYIQKARESGIDYCLSKNSITMGGIVHLIRSLHRAGRI